MADNDNNNKVNGQNPDPLVRDILLSAESTQKKLAKYARAEQEKEHDRLKREEQRYLASRSVNVPKGGGQVEMNLDYDPSSDVYLEKFGDRAFSIDEEYRRKMESYSAGSLRSTTGEINTLSRYRNVQRSVTHMAQGYGAYSGITPDDMFMSSAAREQRSRGLLQNISSGYSRMSEMASLGASPEQILAESAKVQRYKEQAAITERAGKEASLKGYSEEKLIKRADELEQRHSERKTSEKMMSEIKSQKSIDLEKYASEYEKSMEEVSNANKKYKDALSEEMQAIKSGKTQEEIDKLSETVKSAAENLDKFSSQSEEAGKRLSVAQREQASRGGRLGDYLQMAQFAGRAVATVGGAASEIGYYADARKTNATIGTLERTNAVYFNSKKAVLENDISAMFDALAAGPAAEAANQAQSNTYPLADLFGKFVSNTATGAAGAAVMSKGNKAVTVAGGAMGALSTTGDVMDYYKGTVQENTRNQAFDVAMNAYRASTAVQRDKMQTFFSQGMRVYNTTQGLGGAGVELQDALLNNNATLSQLAGAGVSPEKAAQLAAQFSQAGTFKSGDAISAMNMAGEVSKRGIMSKEAYTGLAAQLMGTGGQSSDMERIMKFAVSEGMDNAKSISELVSATQNMSSNLASQGIANAGAVSESLMASVGFLKERGFDPNLAVGAAQTKLMSIDQNMKNTGINLPNLVETQGIRKSLMDRGIFATGTQVANIAEFGFDEMQTLSAAAKKNATPEQIKAARLLAETKGVSDIYFDKNGKIRSDLVREHVVNETRSSTLLREDVTETGEMVSVAAQKIVESFYAAEGNPAQQKKILDDLSKKGSIVAALPNLPVKLASGGGKELADDYAARTGKTFDGAKIGVGAEQEATQAKMSANIQEIGKLYAAQLDANKTAMENITTVMKKLAEANKDTKAEARAIQAADTSKITSDLKAGASDFRIIMGEMLKRMEKLGVVPSKPK